jgi:hypothetical protein
LIQRELAINLTVKLLADKMQHNIQSSPDKDLDIRRFTSLNRNDKSFKAEGVKALQTPSVYIAATFLSIALYWFDNKFDITLYLNSVAASGQQLIKSVKEIDDSPTKLTAFIPHFIASILIIALVLAAKRMFKKRSLEKE